LRAPAPLWRRAPLLARRVRPRRGGRAGVRDEGGRMKDEGKASSPSLHPSSFRLYPSGGGEEFGVEDGRARGAAYGVVTERDEAVVEHVVAPDAADGDAHTIARVAVEPGLRAVLLVAHDDGARRGGVQLQL